MKNLILILALSLTGILAQAQSAQERACLNRTSEMVKGYDRFVFKPDNVSENMNSKETTATLVVMSSGLIEHVIKFKATLKNPSFKEPRLYDVYLNQDTCEPVSIVRKN